jgi:hypothetical protein
MKLEQCMSFFLKGKQALDANETDKAIDLFKSAIDIPGKDKKNYGLGTSEPLFTFSNILFRGLQRYIPRSIPPIKTINFNEPVDKEVKAGAGQKPTRPHPNPKITEPMIRLGVIFFN